MKIKQLICPLLYGTAVCVASAQSPPTLTPPGPPPGEQQPVAPAPPNQPAPPPSNQPSRPRGSRPAGDQVNGAVAQYLLNPHGDVDGLLLADGTQIKFPPHMSADLTRVVKPNDRITAQGTREQGGVFTAFTITNANGQSVTESRPSQFAPPLPPDLRGINLQPMSASGKIKTVLHAPRGEVEGAVLEDGTILRMRPDAGAQFSSLFAVGQMISAKGYGTVNQFGKSMELTELGQAGQTLTPLYAAPGATPPPLPPPAP